jgi:hypothetical protein
MDHPRHHSIECQRVAALKRRSHALGREQIGDRFDKSFGSTAPGFTRRRTTKLK